MVAEYLVPDDLTLAIRVAEIPFETLVSKALYAKMPRSLTKRY